MHGYPSPSKLDQYRKLKEKALQGKLGAESDAGCMYAHGGRNCGVGALFSQAQIMDIKARDLNNVPVSYLARDIGKKNLEAVTGFTLKELENLQCLHDSSAAKLRANPETTHMVQWLGEKIAQEEAKAT